MGLCFPTRVHIHTCLLLCLMLLNSYRYRFSPPAQTRETSAAAWLTASSWTPRSCSQMAPTEPWTLTSWWPSTPPPCSSTASQPAWFTTGCFTPTSAICGTCAWWMQTGCTMQHLTISARSSEQPRTDLWVWDQQVQGFYADPKRLFFLFCNECTGAVFALQNG